MLLSMNESFDQYCYQRPPTRRTPCSAENLRPPTLPGAGAGDRMPTCVGCERRISDQYILKVSPDLEWHAACLKCAECGQRLDETCTCFVRDGKTYCRRDYISRFSAKCASCSVPFVRSDLVMRARDRIYHVDCFRCSVCERRLTSGDEFALTPDDVLCCKADLDAVGMSSTPGTSGKCDESTGDDDVTSNRSSVKPFNNNNNNNDEIKTPVVDGDTVTARATPQPPVTSSSGATTGGHTGKSGGGSRASRSHKSDQKTTRIRTVLNEKQLHTLRTCYGANPRPDALMKEQLVEMTGLSPRVIRVWFQNKRCKDKKRSMLLKQIQQQHHQESAVSMVAASPVHHDQSSSLAPVKVHQYQLLSWAAFLPGSAGDQTTVGIQSPPGAPYQFHGMPDSDQPPFQRLLTSFGNLSDDDEDDTVVSLDEPSSIRVVRQNQVNASLDLTHSAAAAAYLRQHAPGSDGLLMGNIPPAFAVSAHQGVRC